MIIAAATAPRQLNSHNKFSNTGDAYMKKMSKFINFRIRPPPWEKALPM